MTTPLASSPHEVPTWTRKVPTWKHGSKKKLPLIPIVVRNSLRNWWHVHLKTLHVMGCCALVWTGLVNVISASAILPLWSDCPPQPVIDGGRTQHVARNMAGTGAPSTNTLEIDVFCCSVDGPTRPVSCQITLCWTWNQSDVEEKCKCTSPCTTLK